MKPIRGTYLKVNRLTDLEMPDYNKRILGFTGHRPQILGGFTREVMDRLDVLAYRVLDKMKPASVVTGMALGWDQAIANAAAGFGIPFNAIVTFEGQESTWPEYSQKKYKLLIGKAASVKVLYSFYSPEALKERNKYIVRNSDCMVALWGGSPASGTGHCCNYALSIGKPVTNIWPLWLWLKNERFTY
jgi:hypothetical protein